MIASSNRDGSGTIKRRNSSPNETLRQRAIPKQNRKIPHHITTNANIVIDK